MEAVRGSGEAHYGDRMFGAIATGLRASPLVPALLALGFATGFVHYLLDRSVYRLSDPQVRAAARGLWRRCRPRPGPPWASPVHQAGVRLRADRSRPLGGARRWTDVDGEARDGSTGSSKSRARVPIGGAFFVSV